MSGILKWSQWFKTTIVTMMPKTTLKTVFQGLIMIMTTTVHRCLFWSSKYLKLSTIDQWQLTFFYYYNLFENSQFLSDLFTVEIDAKFSKITMNENMGVQSVQCTMIKIKKLIFSALTLILMIINLIHTLNITTVLIAEKYLNRCRKLGMLGSMC